MTTITARPEDLTPDAILKHFSAGRYDICEALLLIRMIQDPFDLWTLIKLGIVYRVTKRYDAAETCYLRALQVTQDSGHLYSNYANMLVDIDRVDEAVAHVTRALELMPDDFVIRKNRAVALREAKRFDEAFEEYERCITHAPDDLNLKLDAANTALYKRDLDRAWELFDARLDLKMVEMIKPEITPVWKGEDLNGKRLLICVEQGFGDTILMTRFIPILAAQGAIVTLGCKPALHELFKDLPCKLVVQGQYDYKQYDYQIAMMSIPSVMEKDWWRWPETVKLHVTDDAQKKFAWLKQHGKKDILKVGILWSGSVTFANNDKRSVPYPRFLDLARSFPNIQFYSFQKGEREKDFDTHGRSTIISLGHTFNNFSETAAALEHMDVIIMTDSALCHLAGAQNVPVIDLLQYLPYWLYMPETPHSAVYDSVRYLRQDTPGDWDPVFAKAKEILTGLQEAKAKDAENFSALSIIDSFVKPALVAPKKTAGTPKAKKKK